MEKEDYMKKIMEINGMSCGHCQARVEKALNEIDGVDASVNLKKNNATVKLAQDISDDVLRKAVVDAGYEVVSITEKNGFF